MQATQTAIETLAERIERAYRRRSSWYRGCSTARVWSTAATVLLQMHQEDPTIPLDPELYVAVQSTGASFDDPWSCLAQPSAGRRFCQKVREMIRGLRAELRGEIRFAERRIGRGEAIREVLLNRGRNLSPLGCYIVASRAGCDELAEHFRLEAVVQHRSCPLYRSASRELLPPGLYPVRQRTFDEELVAMTRQLSPQPNLN